MNVAIKFFSVASLLLAVSVMAQEPQDSQPEVKKPPQPAAEKATTEKPAAPKAAEPAADSIAVTSATVEKIMEQAVRNIARQYNLNPEQEKYTDELMKTRVRAFLRDHESEVWPLIRELLTTQMGTNPPKDIEQVKRIGKAAKPLAKLAQEAILQGNSDWREHLTPEQKALHDFDLAEMEEVFKVINQRFDAWAEGNPPPGGLFPPPTPPNRRPAMPPKPTPGLPDARSEAVAVRESFFDAYVNQFILDNQLDPGQVTAAKSILTEFKAKAQDYKSANKEELTQVAEAQKVAKEAKEKEKLATADEARRQLLQPVYQLFDEMEERLAALLTSVQLEKYKERQAAADTSKQRDAIDQEVLPATPQAAPSSPPAKTAKSPAPKKEAESND